MLNKNDTRDALNAALVAMNKGMGKLVDEASKANSGREKELAATYVEMLTARRKVEDALWNLDH